MSEYEFTWMEFIECTATVRANSKEAAAVELEHGNYYNEDRETIEETEPTCKELEENE